ncbi:MAG: membrane dipeptidase [Gemmatimonadota bacterium]
MKRRDFMRTVAWTGAAAGVGPSMLAGRADAGVPAPARAGPHPGTPIVDGVSPAALTDTYVDMLKQAHVSGWHKSMAGDQSFADAYTFLDRRKDIFVATTAREIRTAHQNGTVALLFGWQDAGALGDVSTQKETPLRAFYQMGLRIVNLVYNVMNQFAGGSLEPHIGLSRIGKRLIAEMHQLNMLVDVGGHSGEQSSLDAIEISRGVPVICSHTNMRGLIDNPRNITDRLAEAIAGTGGVIGLTAINDFNARNRRDANIKATPQVGIAALLNQYDYVKKLVGAEHVGMGNDFVEGRSTRIDPTLPQFTPEMASDQSPINYVKGFEKITELPTLVSGLKERGWTDQEISLAMGGNWLRVYEKVFGG